MEVKFTRKTDKDFRKHRDYVRRQKKSDRHSYQTYELDSISKSFKKNLRKNIGEQKEHKDSIFPKEFEYHSDSHKMYVDKKSHHIVFYKVITPKKGEPYISVEKCINSTEIKKELKERVIKPLKDCDKSLLDDLETVYKEDDVKLRDDTEDEKETKKEKEEVTEQHKTGPQGGKYYRVKIDGKWGPWNSETNESFKSIQNLLTESNIISLSSYLNERLSC